MIDTGAPIPAQDGIVVSSDSGIILWKLLIMN